MGTRGRKSAIDQIQPSNVFKTIERPAPPRELTDQQRAIWFDVVGAHPADTFQPDIWPLLIAYCRHVVEQRHIAGLIEALKRDRRATFKDYDQHLKMQERESRAASWTPARTGFLWRIICRRALEAR